MKQKKIYGYVPRDDEEAADIEAEAEYWRTYKGKGNCLFIFLVGLALLTTPLWVLVA